ncbi:MAG: ABC transporter permease, partial [Oscillospiraceae bacterium]|nr:ABC transporter permease [Oscillospiraceae bacterium]
MRQYLAKRVIINIFILFFVSMMIYLIMRMLPASFLENMARQRENMAGNNRTYEEWLSLLGNVYGTDRNFLVGFFIWIGNAVRGNFGESWYYGVPVMEKFSSVISDSLWLVGTATFIEFAVAIPLGMIAATRQYRKPDYVITVVALLGISLPSFFVASILKLVFSIRLGWFDFYGKVGRDFLRL